MQRSVLNISVPPSISMQFETLARLENKTKSEFFREIFRAYTFSRSWAKIRTWGEQTAREYGVETYDDIEAIAG